MRKLLCLGLIALFINACAPNDTKTSPVATAHQMNKDMPMDYNTPGQTDADHLWLEEVEGEAALKKVIGWNEASAASMQGATYETMKAELLEVYNSPEKIPYISYRAGKVHNFWQDKTNTRGVWRTTSLDSYRSDNTAWETVLDIDALAATDGKNWVYKGNDCLPPLYNRCMVSLSDGGKDAKVVREFDIESKSFVEDGFALDEAKSYTAWLDEDHLLVGTDFGPKTMTESGYPAIMKLWTRGTPIGEAQELYRGEPQDVGVFPGTLETSTGGQEIIIVRATTFYESEYFWVPQTGPNAWTPIKLGLPLFASLSEQFKDQQLVMLREDWDRDGDNGEIYKSGSIVSFSIADFLASGKIGALNTVLVPSARQSVESLSATKSALLLTLYDNVAGAAYALDFRDGVWSKAQLDFPKNGNVSISAANAKEDTAFISTESFLQPDTLWSVNTKTLKTAPVKSLPAWFDASSMIAEQHEAISTDGTKIPYFVVRNKAAKMNGKNPTLLYGYGGFEIALNPSYSSTIGRAWLARGGVYVLANTRGGGEFGPAWHQAGLKTKRQIIYDDFIAVAEDLIARKITSPEHLGAHGRSNGGLLMGVMFTQRPDLFSAVVIGVPLLDMRRYDKLLAGASWVGEYGDPDDEGEEGAYIRGLSPYHNIRSDTDYPQPYIYTSTKDDRVHPAHARKFAQRLEDLGLPFLYYENIDGGHAGAANLEETAHSQALIYSYLASTLMP